MAVSDLSAKLSMKVVLLMVAVLALRSPSFTRRFAYVFGRYINERRGRVYVWKHWSIKMNFGRRTVSVGGRMFFCQKAFEKLLGWAYVECHRKLSKTVRNRVLAKHSKDFCCWNHRSAISYTPPTVFSVALRSFCCRSETKLTQISRV